VNPIAPRRRMAITLGVLILMALHAVVVAPAHVASSLQSRIMLGAYVAGLSAFMGALASAVAWHSSGPRPGARLQHVFISAWWLAGMAAVGGMVLSVVADATSSGLERAWGSAFLGSILGTLLGTRQAPVWLTAWATKAPPPEQPPRAQDAQRSIALGALAASGVWGAAHPVVRFPLFVPHDPGGVFLYAALSITVTAVVLPFAGARLMRALRTSGAVRGQKLDARLPLRMFVVVLLGAGAWLLVAPPLSLELWCLFRGVVGALLGSTGAAWGAGRFKT
jgi:hypothetical protein